MDQVTRSGGNGSRSPDPFPRIDLPPVGLLSVDVATDGDGSILTLSGELDLATIERAERGLRSALASSGSGRVVIDLRELTFICSTGIKFLVKACRDGGSGISVIESEAPGVKRVLSIVGLDLDCLGPPAGVAAGSDRPRDA